MVHRLRVIPERGGEVNALSADLWKLWVREYGAREAIAFALRSGYTREQILQANGKCRQRAENGPGRQP